MSIYCCEKCRAEYELLNSRFNGLDNAKWEYENLKGKGSFAKDNKTVAKIYDALKEQKALLLQKHMEHILSAKPKASAEIAQVRVEPSFTPRSG